MPNAYPGAAFLLLTIAAVVASHSEWMDGRRLTSAAFMLGAYVAALLCCVILT